MKMKIKISVIVPVFQVKEQYLRQCIDSILGQSLNELELILIDDGSTDGSANILAEYGTKDERVVVFSQKNMGVSVARNKGIELSHGKWLTFVDSDDYIAHDNCMKVIERAEQDDLDLLLWGSFKCYENKEVPYMPYVDDIRLFSDRQKEQLQMKTMVGTLPFYEYPCSRYGSGSACSKLYRRDFLIENHLLYQEGLKRAEDVNFNIRVFEAAKRIGYMNQHFYYYRQLCSSATYTYRENGIEVFTAALMCLEDFIREKKKPDIFWQIYYMRCIFFFLESMDMDYLNRQNKKPLRLRITNMREVADTYPYCKAISEVNMKVLDIMRRIPIILLRKRQMWLLCMFYRGYRLLKH